MTSNRWRRRAIRRFEAARARYVEPDPYVLTWEKIVAAVERIRAAMERQAEAWRRLAILKPPTWNRAHLNQIALPPMRPPRFPARRTPPPW